MSSTTDPDTQRINGRSSATVDREWNPPPFSISVTGNPRTAVVAVCGEVDRATAPQLAEVLDRVIGNGLPITLDLAGLAFIDTSGMRVLAEARQQSARRGLPWVIQSAPTSTRRMLAIMGVSDLCLVATRDDVTP